MSVEQYDVVRFDVIGDIDGSEDIVQTYQARLTTPTTVSDLQALADWKTIFGDIWDLITALHNVLVVFRRVRGQNLTKSTLLGESAFATVKTGTATGDALPNQLTIPVSFKTNIPNVMLRKLLGPAAEGNVDADGVYGTGVGTAVGLYVDFMLDDLVGTYGVWEYGYNSPKTLDFEVPLIGIYSLIPGTLRRRRIGVGS